MCVLPFCPESPAFLIKAQGEEATWTVGHTGLEPQASRGPLAGLLLTASALASGRPSRSCTVSYPLPTT